MASTRFQVSQRGRLGDFTTDKRVLLIIALAVFVGMAGAASAWLLLKLTAFFTNLFWAGRISVEDILPGQGSPWVTLLVPALGGLIIGLMARFGSEKIRGHGIPEAIEAILIGRSRLSPKVAVLKPVSSAISIGSGGPFGAEGPIIMTGGAVGSLFAQCLHLSDVERKTLLVAGAAAGMTGIFGTPLAAVLLAVELLLFEWKPRSVLPVIAAVVVASACRPYLLGSLPLFPMSVHVDLPVWGLLACVGVGIIGGLQSGLMTKLLYATEDAFQRLPIHWMWWPMLGGLVIGVGGLVEPRALGVGYDVIRDILAGQMQTAAAVDILVVKSLIWVVALASGTSGGVLAPLLIFGGLLGGLEGQFLPGGASYWALIGMTAMMGGTMRAPFTAVMFALELTGNFSMLLPLLIAASSAYAVTVLLLRRSILTEKIARRGQHLTREYSVDPFALMLVSDVMVKDVETLRGTMTVGETMSFFSTAKRQRRSYPVVGESGDLQGIVSGADVLRWGAEDEDFKSKILADLLGDTTVTIAYPDQVLSDVADLMVARDLSRIPVVQRGGQSLVGLIARRDLLRTRGYVSAAEQDRERFFGASARSATNTPRT